MKLSMKFISLGLVTAMGALALQGCVVAPAQPAYAAAPAYGYTQPVQPGPTVTYVAPTYAAPAVGFYWAFHPRFGWGYYHPQQGWHRGWR